MTGGHGTVYRRIGVDKKLNFDSTLYLQYVYIQINLVSPTNGVCIIRILEPVLECNAFHYNLMLHST